MEVKGRILVVDDELSIRQLCRRILLTAGYEMDDVSTGDEAIRRLCSHAYDLVLCDLRMPGKTTGESLVRTIHEHRLKTQVIVMTGYPSLATAIETLRDGAFEYLIKPFDMMKLIETVKAGLRSMKSSDAETPKRVLPLDLLES